ncbi:MAG TPA: hypothetical protein VII25_11870 [Candidatus Acidoferrum sp.]
MVFNLVGVFEVDVVFFGIPEVEGEVNAGAGRVLEELSLSEVWIALK